MRKVVLHPTGKPQRKCRQDDLVEGLTVKGGAYRLHGVGIPDSPTDLGPKVAEEGEGRLQVAPGYFVSSALGPGEMFMGGRSRDDDVNFGGARRHDVLHLLGQPIAGKGLVPDDQVAPHGSLRPDYS